MACKQFPRNSERASSDYARGLLALLLICGVSGCAPVAGRVDAASVASRSVVPEPILPEYVETIDRPLESAATDDPRLDADVLALDANVRAELLAHLDAASKRQRLQQLVELMQSPQQLGLRYTATATNTAMETLRTGEGNCLALSALFVAVARAAGLDARFQDVELLPTWRQDGDVFVSERHINAVVAINGEPLIVDFLVQPAGSTVRSHVISDRAMTAQYLNNIGVEHLAAGRIALAYRFFRRSIEASPDTPYLWLNLGVALSRNDQRDDAEAVYLHAVLLDERDAVALSNLAALYEASGRGELAQSAQLRVERLRRGNPYYRYWQAEGDYRGGDYAGAITQLRAALALKPAEGAFYFALARAYIQTGARHDADRSFADALRFTTDAGTRASYEAQYRELIEAKLSAVRTE